MPAVSVRGLRTLFNFQLKSSFVVHVLCAEDRKLLASTLKKKSSYKDNQIEKVNNFKNFHAGIGHFGHIGFKEKDKRGREQSQTRLVVLKNGKTGKRHFSQTPSKCRAWYTC